MPRAWLACCKEGTGTSRPHARQRVWLLALVSSGMQRDDAYRIVQRLAQQAWDTATPLRSLLEAEDVALDYDAVFDYGYYTRHVPEALARLEVIGCPPC